VSTTSVRKSRTTSTSASTPMSPITRGRVIFVGTGPGDPDLLTLGAIAALADASAVILDSDRQQPILTHPAITLAEDAEVTTLGLSEAGRCRRRLGPSSC
jgi:uroporphyrinogen III methyltransferase / synthase